MQITIHHPYVTFETNEKNNAVAVNFLKDGKIVEQVYTCLGPNEEKEEKYFVDMTEFLGETLELEIVPCASEWKYIPEGDLTKEQMDSRLCFVRNEASYTSAQPYSEPYRPHYHYTTKRGWINDPNGCIYHDGLYHLYYQHCPGTAFCFYENNHWSHAVSRDLVSWKECQPVLRYPHEASGTAFINRENGKVCAAAGNRILESDDGGFSYRFKSQITTGAGDPKVFWHEGSGRYIAITLGENYTFVVSSSEDLIHWTRESVLEGFHECPEIAEYTIEGTDTRKWVLNGGDGAYLIGEFDGHTFIPDPIDEDRPDPYATVAKQAEAFSDRYNGVYIDRSTADPSERWRWYTAYALQHFNNAPNDRHVRMGWFLVNYNDLGMPFNQAMTFAQELTLKHTPMGLRLCALPVSEIAHYYTACETAEGLNPCVTVAEGPAFDVSVECEAGDTVRLADYTIRYSASEKRIYVTQSNGHTFYVPFADNGGKLKIRALFDVMMCELYFGEGEVYFPHPSMEKQDGIRVCVEGSGTVRVASVGKTMVL